MRSRSSGITLIELLVVVAVVAILGSIAVPSYRNYMLRTQRTDATTALLRIQTAQEKAFLQNNVYATQVAGAPPAGLNMNVATEGGKYNLDINGDGATYVASAVPVPGAGQDDDTKCQTFTIDQNGTRAATDGGGADQTQECWRR